MKSKHVRDLQVGDRVAMVDPDGEGVVRKVGKSPLFERCYEIVVYRDDIGKEGNLIAYPEEVVEMSEGERV